MKTAARNSLSNITKQKTGIVVLGTHVLALNWDKDAPEGGIPVMSPVCMPVSVTVEGDIEVLSGERVEDIRTALPGRIVPAGENDEGVRQIRAEGMEIKYDAFNQIPALWGFDMSAGAGTRRSAGMSPRPTGGTVYRVRCGEHEALVIAPDGWE